MHSSKIIMLDVFGRVEPMSDAERKVVEHNLVVLRNFAKIGITEVESFPPDPETGCNQIDLIITISSRQGTPAIKYWIKNLRLLKVVARWIFSGGKLPDEYEYYR